MNMRAGSIVVLSVVDWIKCFREYRKEYRSHAIQKLVERNIDFTEIDEITDNLKVVKEYEEDTPYPSCLVLGFSKAKRPLHVVFSVDHSIRTVYMITVYEPDVTRWSEDFTRRNQ